MDRDIKNERCDSSNFEMKRWIIRINKSVCPLYTRNEGLAKVISTSVRDAKQYLEPKLSDPLNKDADFLTKFHGHIFKRGYATGKGPLPKGSNSYTYDSSLSKEQNKRLQFKIRLHNRAIDRIRNEPPVTSETLKWSKPKGILIQWDSLIQLFHIIEERYRYDSKWGSRTNYLLFPPEIADYVHKKAGIYMIKNNVTKKFYIGRSANLQERLYSYCSLSHLDVNLEHSAIYRKIWQFGVQNFSFAVIEHCSPEDLSKREQLYIEQWRPQYNIRKRVHKNKE